MKKKKSSILGDLCHQVVKNYLDDIVIDAIDWYDMLNKPRLALDKLRETGFTLKASKCSFSAHRIEFLGFIIENGSLRPCLNNTLAISDFSIPTNTHGERIFL